MNNYDEEIIKDWKAILKKDEMSIDKSLSCTIPIKFAKETYDLLNRLQVMNDKYYQALMAECMLSNCTREKEIRNEAIKEFWEKLKKKKQSTFNRYKEIEYEINYVEIKEGEELLKKMLNE